ncbi:hypothetical protein AC579_8800 [Pseudocercospora musae]|uniref:Uncharacterized protein n=1 Tax=Pseudocercospora musae TaxID=113226 RepID=A0A139HAD5_9PEZI|nr:hypothetical protein AC579_8800 [Pseudocercospora musae]
MLYRPAERWHCKSKDVGSTRGLPVHGGHPIAASYLRPVTSLQAANSSTVPPDSTTARASSFRSTGNNSTIITVSLGANVNLKLLNGILDAPRTNVSDVLLLNILCREALSISNRPVSGSSVMLNDPLNKSHTSLGSQNSETEVSKNIDSTFSSLVLRSIWSSRFSVACGDRREAS